MPLNVRMLFSNPRTEIGTSLCSLMSQCTSASIVCGFMTIEGVDLLARQISASPAKLSRVVVGAGTYRAFDAYDRLLNMGVSPDRLLVHLGHTRLTTTRAKHSFYRYHPMLHSKIYLFDLPNGRSTAIVGSHNMTGFALKGLNGEASVYLEGEEDDAVFVDIKEHIEAAADEAVIYDPSLREAYAWWSHQFTEGFSDKFNDAPREGEAQRTIVIITESGGGYPSVGDKLYFEIPAGLGRLTSLSSDIHLYVFRNLPPTPGVALATLGSAEAAYWCSAIGLEDDQGGRELQADWLIDSTTSPTLRRAPRPFRPQPAPGMQQVRVEVRELHGSFEYLFAQKKSAFEPILQTEQPMQLSGEAAAHSAGLEVIPPEHLPWFRVAGLRRKDDTDSPSAYSRAMQELSPEAGSYLLMSPRRYERG